VSFDFGTDISSDRRRFDRCMSHYDREEPSQSQETATVSVSMTPGTINLSLTRIIPLRFWQLAQSPLGSF
jgi:hypothetical protein